MNKLYITRRIDCNISLTMGSEGFDSFLLSYDKGPKVQIDTKAKIACPSNQLQYIYFNKCGG